PLQDVGQASRKAASPLQSSPLACTRSGSFGQPSCCSSPNIAFTTVLPVGFVRAFAQKLALFAQNLKNACAIQPGRPPADDGRNRLVSAHQAAQPMPSASLKITRSSMETSEHRQSSRKHS